MRLLQDRLQALFEARVVCAVATAPMYLSALHPQEQVGTERFAQDRLAEFRAGRAVAREALKSLGVERGVVARLGDGAPAWPEGVIGSISHCDGFCGAVVGWTDEVSGVGFDAETREDLEAEILPLICSERERSEFQALPNISSVDWPKLAFSGKEAFYKCYHPLCGRFLDFLDVEVRFQVGPNPCEGTFTIGLLDTDAPLWRYQKCFLGRWIVDENHIFTGVTLPVRS